MLRENVIGNAERFIILADVYRTMSLTCAVVGVMPFREIF
jgi:hypothetical protein